MGKERDGREDRPTPVAVGRTVASALAVAIIEDRIRRSGELAFPGLGIKLTKDRLLKPEGTGKAKTPKE